MSRRSTSDFGRRGPHDLTVGFRLLHDGFVSSLVPDNAVVHTLDVRLGGRRARATLDLEVSEFFVITYQLAQEFGRDDVHRRLAILFVHQAGELFQPLERVIREVPILN